MQLSAVIILLIDQPDLGQSILLTGSWIATVFISGVSLIYIFVFFSIFFILKLIFVLGLNTITLESIFGDGKKHFFDTLGGRG